MKLTKLASLGMIGFIGLSFGASQVLADDPITATTEGDVSFTAPLTGALTITNVPATITFGAHTIAGSTQQYAAPVGTEIGVQDLRGTGAGWTLQASASEFVNTGDGNIKLNGAKLLFPEGTVSKVNDDNTATAPTGAEATIPADGSGAVNILKADLNQGQGGWLLNWDDTAATPAASDLKLEVPTALVGSFQSTITWTLLDAPQ